MDQNFRSVLLDRKHGGRRAWMKKKKTDVVSRENLVVGIASGVGPRKHEYVSRDKTHLGGSSGDLVRTFVSRIISVHKKIEHDVVVVALCRHRQRESERTTLLFCGVLLSHALETGGGELSGDARVLECLDYFAVICPLKNSTVERIVRLTHIYTKDFRSVLDLHRVAYRVDLFGTLLLKKKTSVVGGDWRAGA